MELIHTCLIDHRELTHQKFDVIIAASGYQERCTYLMQNIKQKNNIRLLITFNEDNLKKVRSLNEKYFTDLGFTTVEASPDDSKEINRILKKICSSFNTDELKILVDYSCMPKKWFAIILDYFMRNELSIKLLSIYFSYTPTEFILKKSSSSIKYFGPILNSDQHLPSSKPVSLIIGLGRSSDIAVEVISKIKPERMFFFLPDPAFDESYTDYIRESNSRIINMLPEDHLLTYPANDTDEINSQLTSLCLDLRLDSRVMILPHGPKTFALISLLLAARYPDIWLWETITKTSTTENEGKPYREPVVTKAIFCQEDDEDENEY
jgi:hypothetical protein